MVSQEQLRLKFGEKGDTYFAYLKNKNRGGTNNSKGNSFENYFAIYLFAKLFNQSTNFAGTLFSTQTFSFVDDLVIEVNAANNAKFYQIKDVESLSWFGGNHPIQTDFEVQYHYSCSIGLIPELYMTVSREQVHDSLSSQLPESIKSFTKVLYFKTANSISNLLKHNVEFKTEITKICAISKPSFNILETVATIILGVWDASEKKSVPMNILLDKCYAINPHYIKGAKNNISKELHVALSSLEGFSFNLNNGFLVWNYKLSDKGILPFPVGTNEFSQWENDILQFGFIESFEILEPFLS